MNIWPRLYFVQKIWGTDIQQMSMGGTFTFNNIILFSPQIPYLTTSIMEQWTNSARHFLYFSNNYEQFMSSTISILWGFHFIIWLYNTHKCRVSHVQTPGVIFICGYFTSQQPLTAWGPGKLKYKLFIKISIILHLVAYTIC